jgi:phage terminase small subunit
MTLKQTKFVQEYQVDYNGTRAAIAAGFSEKTAAVQAVRLLRNHNIIAELQRIKQEMVASGKLTREKVIDELRKIAFSDINKVLGDDNEPLDLQDVDKEYSAAVAGVKITVTENEFGTKTKKELTLWDKTRALEMLGRYFGIFEKDNNQLRPAIQVNIER